MQFPGHPELGHLTYCTNIHPGEAWPEVLASLQRHLPAIRQQTSADQPFGLGLRLSAAAAEALRNPAALADLRAVLDAENAYVFTINGFVYGSPQGRQVKEEVYAPDWSTPERLSYANTLADILAELLPSNMTGSISTVPGSFGAWAERRAEVITHNIIRHAAYLARLRERTGRTIALALEPEPGCMLETSEETAGYFETALFSSRSATFVSGLTGLPQAAAAEALRRHLGVCYNSCHAAVQFEDPKASLELLRSKDIPIAKLQLSSGLRIKLVAEDTLKQLRAFNDPVSLHQVVASTGLRHISYLDLPQALQELDRNLGREWRVRFQLPVYLAQLDNFSTTQDFLREVLALHRAAPLSDHLEVESSTWDVLPERYRGTGVSTAIARELNWVREQLCG